MRVVPMYRGAAIALGVAVVAIFILTFVLYTHFGITSTIVLAGSYLLCYIIIWVRSFLKNIYRREDME